MIYTIITAWILIGIGHYVACCSKMAECVSKKLGINENEAFVRMLKPTNLIRDIPVLLLFIIGWPILLPAMMSDSGKKYMEMVIDDELNH